jgi:ethanolamine utilization protein EutQ
MTVEKAAVRIERFNNLAFAPRFEYGEMAEVSAICGAEDGTELGVGWGRLSRARIPWTINTMKYSPYSTAC